MRKNSRKLTYTLKRLKGKNVQQLCGSAPKESLTAGVPKIVRYALQRQKRRTVADLPFS